MNRKRIAQYCCAALVAAGIGLNIQNATANYGITENRLALMAVGGSNSASGTIWDSFTNWVSSLFNGYTNPDSTNPKPDNTPKRYGCIMKHVDNHEPVSGTVGGCPPHVETYTTEEYRCTSVSGTEATYTTLEECKKSGCED